MNKERVIDDLEALYGFVRDYEHNPLEANGIYRAIELIRRMPDDSSWIPVTEQLPEEDQMVWVTKEYHGGERHVDKSYFRDGEFELVKQRWIVMTKLVKAWMPRFVPEPYKEEL